MKFKHFLLTALLCSLFSFSLAAEDQSKITLCYDEENNYPWTLKDADGLAIKEMQLLAKKLNINIETKKMPWKRCLVALTNNEVDGAINSSFNLERSKMGAYPMSSDNTPDPTKSMHTSSYTLYRLKGSTLSWDGKQFNNLGPQQPIGIPRGFSIADTLKKAGATVAENARTTSDIFEQLILNRIAGAALQTSEGNTLLKDKKFNQSIEAVTPPLVKKEYYLMLSFALLKKAPAFANKIWEALATVRDSEEFKDIEAKI